MRECGAKKVGRENATVKMLSRECLNNPQDGAVVPRRVIVREGARVQEVEVGGSRG